LACKIADGEIKLAIAVEIANRDGAGLTAYIVGGLGLKRAVAIPEKDRHFIVGSVGYSKVNLTVSVEIAYDHAVRGMSDRIGDG
jgi:hypothetical protein